MNIAKFSVKNSVLVNLLMIGLFIFGWISLNNMPTELNPPVSFNWVFITVTYPGASPIETENLIVDPMESEIKNVDDIDEIQSTAGEGYGFVLVKFKDISLDDFRQRYNELKSELDKVDFPEDAEDPLVDDFSSSDFLPLINVNMSYLIPEANAQLIAEEIQDEMEDAPGVAKVQVSGLAEREIWIEVDPERMNSRSVTFDNVIFALKSRNLNVPGGNISIGKTEYLIRSIGEYESIDQIRSTIIKTAQNGEFVRIRDIAKVSDTREELAILSRLNGEKSISFSVSKNADANSIDVIDEIKKIVEDYRLTVPSGVEFSYTNDNAVWINRIIDVLRNNAITGMLLIILILYFFLGKGNALLASLGIPISFFITFILMDLFGYSLNGNTLFALVMVLGIIVDDAIIVVENCHRYRLLGYNSYDSAIMGTREVVRPILSSIGTNIAAFLPLILLPGIMGKFMRIIPIVFSLALIASLFEAFFLLPSHYADWTKNSKAHAKGEKKFFKVLRSHYTKILIKVLRWRYWVTAGLVVVLFSSFAIIPLVGVELFGEEDWDVIRIFVKFPEGTSLEETNRIVQKYEEEAYNLSKENVEAVVTNVGLLQSDEDWLVKKNVAQIIIQLKPIEERNKSTDDLISALRKNCSDISGAISKEFLKVSGGPPVGKPISIKAQGKYLDDIKTASLALQDSVKKIEGTFDVSDNFPPGKKEIQINIDEDKAAMFGFSIQTIAMYVRYAFDGIVVTEFRDADDEIDILVKYNEKYRSSLDDVLNLKISNTQGNTVSLRDLVSFNITTGPTEIRRIDQDRTIFITGDINDEIITLDKISAKIEELFPIIEAQFQGVTFSFGGQYDEFNRTFDNILSLFMLSLILIFLILGTQFGSYSQPLIILTTVPFAIIGSMLGLLISNNPFSIVSMFGFIALAGIVVNDAIILITFINNRREEEYISSYQLWKSVVEAGRLRLRPIILTSFTTISGLVPLAFGIGGQSEMWAPLANVIVFGLIVSTVLTLFIIPCFVAIIDDIKGSRKKTTKI
jgi:CzcA family heavy metal efflux pump